MVQIKQRANYTAPSDTLVLEDESGRVLLAPAALPSGASFPLAALARVLVTGVVVVVRGTVLPSGELAVSDIAVPGLLPSSLPPGPPLLQPPLPPPRAPDAPPTYVLLLSDLGAGVAAAAGGAAGLPLALLAEWVAGLSGGGGAGGVAAGRVARIIIAGGLVGVLPERGTGGGGGGSGGGGGHRQRQRQWQRCSDLFLH